MDNAVMNMEIDGSILRRAVFLDRDGTINRDSGYIKNIGEMELLEGAPEAIRLLKQHGFLVIVVTNQSGIARGYYTEEDLKAVNRYLLDRLQQEGAAVDDVFYCPHHPDFGGEKYRRDCICRKPGPGMILEAAEKYGIDLECSYIIGDSFRDVEAGHRAGVKGLLISEKQSPGEKEIYSREQVCPIYTGKSLLDCVRWLLKHENATNDKRNDKRGETV